MGTPESLHLLFCPESWNLRNYSPPTAKFIINEIIFPIVMVVNKIFRLMDGEHDVQTYSR
jgi:hypothetical protein